MTKKKKTVNKMTTCNQCGGLLVGRKNLLKHIKDGCSPKKKTVKVKNGLPGFPRCNALDQDGKQCRKHSGITHDYFGEKELYGYDGVSWVRVNLCIEHAIKVGHDFTKK